MDHAPQAVEGSLFTDHDLDLEVIVKGVKCASSAPSVWHRRLCLDAILYDSSAIQSEHNSGCALVVRKEVQQLPLAFEC